MENTVFWYMASCGSYEDRRFGRIYLFELNVEKNQRIKNSINVNYQIEPRWFFRV
jgi:hypothetical protein